MTRMKEIIKIKKIEPEHKVKFYRGKRLGPRDSCSDIKVVVGVRYDDGIEVIIGPLKHRIYHSPTGFEWGYMGSGPSDLARSILWDYLDQEPTRDLYMEFKEKFVSGWKDEWEITSKKIQDWISGRRNRCM